MYENVSYRTTTLLVYSTRVFIMFPKTRVGLLIRATFGNHGTLQSATVSSH